MLVVAYLTWLSQPAWLRVSICSLSRGSFPFTTQSTNLTHIPCAVGTAQLFISVAFRFLSLCAREQGGTPDKIPRSPELSRVVCFTRCITKQSFSVKPPLSAPDYHPLLPFCFKYTEIEKPLFLHVDSSSCTEGVEIYLWSAGFSFPSSVPSQTSPCLLATVAEWETKEVLMLWERCSAIT